MTAKNLAEIKGYWQNLGQHCTDLGVLVQGISSDGAFWKNLPEFDIFSPALGTIYQAIEGYITGLNQQSDFSEQKRLQLSSFIHFINQSEQELDPHQGVKQNENEATYQMVMYVLFLKLKRLVIQSTDSEPKTRRPRKSRNHNAT